MDILSKNQLVEYLLKYISAPADKPLMVWCGSNLSLDDLYLRNLTEREQFKPSGKISSIEHYLPDDAAFVINHAFAGAFDAKNIGICTSFVREKHMPLIALVNDSCIPGKAKRPGSPYTWGTDYDIEDIEGLMPANVKDEFIHVCYKPSLPEYIEDLESGKYTDDGLLPIFIDYAKSKMNLPYIDPYCLNRLFEETGNLAECAEMHPLPDDMPEDGPRKLVYLQEKEHNDEILAGKPFTAEAAESRANALGSLFVGPPNKRTIKDFYDLPKDFINFLEGTSAAWIVDSTKPHPEPYCREQRISK